MQHIAYITSEYPHKNTPPVGGIGSFVKMMASSLIKKGYQVTIFLCLSSNEKIWFDGDIRIVEIKAVKPNVLSVFKDRLKIRKYIKKHIKEDTIDLIEAPDWEGLHVFCNFKIPLVTRIHGSVTYFNTLQKLKTAKLLYFIEKKALLNSKGVVSVSNYAAEKTKEIFKIPLVNLKVIHNGINVDEFVTKTNEEEENLLLHFGTLTRKKGVLDLPNIFNALHKIQPNCKLLILGKDTIDVVEKKSTWKIMKNNFSENALKKVTYLGPVSLQDVKHKIATASACIFPSYAETFGLVTVESMAMSKVVIIYDKPWVREIIEDKKDGILIETANFTKNAQIIAEILNQKDLIHKIGNNAKSKVALKFNLEDKILENINFYKKMTGSE